jgi:general secretion pathway protein D
VSVHALLQPRSSIIMSALLIALATPGAPAQNGRPEPATPPVVVPVDRPAPEQIEDPMIQPPDPAPPGRAGDATDTRREVPEGKVTLAFNDVSVEETIPFIVETTGKVVLPVRVATLRSQKITLINDTWIDRVQALDLLFSAFRLNDIGVIETEDRIIIGSLTDLLGDFTMPVLGPDDDVRGRADVGNLVIKIFRLERASAADIGEQLRENLPDYASLTVDENSNQIMLIGDVGLCQRFQEIIDQLDQTFLKVRTKTYRLQYADASEIAENITELFEESGTSAGASRQAPRRPARGRPGQAQQQSQVTGQPGPTAELRITVNIQQNAVTVQADPAVIDEIDRLITTYWDLPRPEGTSKMYKLQYTDPLKVRDLLQELLEQGSSAGARRSTTTAGGRGGGAGVQEQLGGIYRLEAYPDSNSLLVLCKTEESFTFLDSIIASLDQPTSVGLPLIVELKHADAVALADELNVLLSEAGSQMTLERPDSGLSGQGIGGEGQGETATAGGATGRETQEGGEIRFPWQTSGRQREDQTPETPLIGKTRIVPIIRQNALAILAPPQFQEHVLELVEYLDRPGRQVMISAILAEVELNDDFALGLRISGDSIPLTNIDNSIVGSTTGEGTQNDILSSLFDVSVLNVGFSANWTLQALAQQTDVRILQEPRVFTADNQEAVFFDGQDIPFVTDSFTNNVGGLTQGFEYRQVGVVLNVRPRITAQRDVDMEIYLELSSVVPGITLFGGAIVDRRSTTTQIVVQNGQTIVLSGILTDSDSEIVRKIPVLGDIPILGELFRSRENATKTTELVAFITPIVVDNPSDNDANFNAEERSRLERLRDFDMGANHDAVRDRLRDRIVTPPHLRPLLAPPGESQVLDEEVADDILTGGDG